MTIAQTTDMDLFFDDFGITATVGGDSITVVFSNPYQVIDVGGQYAEGVVYEVIAKTAEISALSTSLVHGVQITVDGSNYMVD